MPAKNTIKTYVKDGYYHVYNRGVEKRIIYQDEQDYKVFLRYLKEALEPPPNRKTKTISFTLKGESFKGIPKQSKNFYKSIELVAFCLMPNHFHLLLKQLDTRSIEIFTRSLMTRFAMYFNKRYHRVGSLFQGPYKAANVENDAYLLHLSRYIHRNPLGINRPLLPSYSSYAAYLGKQSIPWLKPQIVLSFFNQKSLPILKKTNSYTKFVEYEDINEEATLGSLTIDL